MEYVIRLSETILSSNPFSKYLVNAETGNCQRDNGYFHIIKYGTKEEAQIIANEMNRKFGIKDNPSGYSYSYVVEKY